MTWNVHSSGVTINLIGARTLCVRPEMRSIACRMSLSASVMLAIGMLQSFLHRRVACRLSSTPICERSSIASACHGSWRMAETAARASASGSSMAQRKCLRTSQPGNSVAGLQRTSSGAIRRGGGRWQSTCLLYTSLTLLLVAAVECRYMLAAPPADLPHQSATDYTDAQLLQFLQQTTSAAPTTNASLAAVQSIIQVRCWPGPGLMI